jgi:DNA-binding CsgD family transcriptional regulator
VGAYAKERAVERIARTAHEAHDLIGFWDEAAEAIARCVPHYLAPCWFTLDPSSLLATSHYDHGVISELPPEWLALEYREDDVHKMADVARSEGGVSTLHAATHGDPSRSLRWSTCIQPFGADQEMLVALRTSDGEAWGILSLYREPGQASFDREDAEFLRAVAPHLAEGARRGLLMGEAAEPDGPDAPGLLVLDASWEVESMTPGVERWLEALPGGARDAQAKLPPSVLAVAGRALGSTEQRTAGEVALCRVRARDGRWLVLHGAPLVAPGATRVAVIIESAHPARISPLLMSAYGMTEREGDVTRLVLRGDSTAQIADALCISTHTVQQHLKSVFEKTGVHSRRDLVGKVFFAHYEPRFRDNERRAIDGQPLRGAPSYRLTRGHG